MTCCNLLLQHACTAAVSMDLSHIIAAHQGV